MIAIVDYGAGNLGSVCKAFRHIGAEVEVTGDPHEIARADALVLPGVGAFSHCMSGLERIRAAEAVRGFIRSGRPFLGICVGLQMLFEESEEMGRWPGLGVLCGKVVRFPSGDAADAAGRTLKVPHIGWNTVSVRPESRLLRGVAQNERFYFVHSYYAAPDESSVTAAETEYGVRFCSAVERGNLFATQFHPEKSGAAGLRILRNFTALTA